MREHYEAFGDVCAAAIANGDDIISSANEMTSENGDIAMNISHGGAIVFISAYPSTEYLSAGIIRRYTNIEAFNIKNLPHISDAEEILTEDESSMGFDGSVQTIPVEDGQVELFDGISVRRPLYAYDNDFGLKQYRHTLTDIVGRSRDIFQNVTEKLEIDTDAEGATSETQSEPSQMRSFQ